MTRNGACCWLTMVTGGRRGELCSIRWRNIDFDRANLWIELATTQPRSGIIEKEPKSGEGRRVSLDPHTLELLRQHKTDVTKQLLTLGVPLTGDTFVFSTTPDYSQPRKPRSVTQKYRLMATRLRMRSTRLHALRHHSATELLAAGVDLRTVAGRLGHGDGTPGDQLPTVVQLAAEFTVAAGTAHRAMATLAAESLITVARGKRAVVTRLGQRPSPDLVSKTG